MIRLVGAVLVAFGSACLGLGAAADLGRRVRRLEAVSAGLELLEEADTAIVTLREGKYHQIKRMLASRGKPVRYLKRLTMGPLSLDPALKRGEWRPLTGEELAALRTVAGL